MKRNVISIPIKDLVEKNSYIEDFFSSIGLRDYDDRYTLEQLVDLLTDEFIDGCGMGREEILTHFKLFIEKMEELKVKSEKCTESITILGGHDKLGKEENISITVKPGEIISLVGPTGSGKSRFLADIECIAQKDTQTGRQVLVNGKTPDLDERFSLENKLVAQLSQNMNFVIDLTVDEFITMHAESRMINNIKDTVGTIIKCANELAGEKFSPDMPVTQLSGGQSRALMIADTALLSISPIVLIDEIENAGIDREKAMELLVKKEKIVFMSTHDPLLALMGNKRIAIRNGGVNKIIETSSRERENLVMLKKFDTKMMELRNIIRRGDIVDFDIGEYMKL
ncbi:ATP-binding cassette domain-containing protein [Clostridium luticellarii]|jgi:ABC-type lipoprotein export system ATPase subunit|uniref:Aliphatic sulfonates import ATP-binding protein SsuB n=1 Tax=Clostridium luticellarii TaxID=1691940 RepID=A0A2T0BME9_9CLOT|nr:ATP-binding cassette domain-containing protein [Clostridium luticellarii]MCI1944976.1 ATP-binding cassette domain-containing protein [Clostridium luticellarii]MCI1967874.1 ATP-binding cassette domain-containing protein [Clostridium luticellarii]MCI1995757.1 ATP-binding cassette domain-containing protein [Clostridium luticellarii]MCI2040732.1 ATP-binding cassette domain-containing protein [Clostridium luticellarii]PRR85064.1 Aliphatic sulfonates import ATP-binding protein SsuB [Clostridium l